jgi:transcriptional regulator with XRE-family HTH domain
LEPDQALGLTLRTLRNKRKWSQTELALRADVDRNYISLVELGRNSPSVRLLFKLCDALDMKPSDLIKDVEKRLKAAPSQGDTT